MTGSSDPFSGLTAGHRGRRIDWEGHALLELDSTELTVTISLSRGAEFLEIRDKDTDVDILWHGHDDVRRNRVAPATIALPSGSFLDHFAGGWQVVFPSAHFPTTIAGAPVGQHGEVALLPWHLDEVGESAHEVWAELHVDARRVPVRMTRRVTLSGRRLTIADTIENRSGQSLQVQWGHHLALGGLMAHPGSVVVLPEGSRFTVPRDSSGSYRYASGEYSWPRVTKRDGEPEDLSILPVDDGTDGHAIVGPVAEGRAEVVSAAAGLRMILEWDADVMPYCWIWGVFGGFPEWPMWGQHRLFTLEPFTSPLESLDDSVAAGRALPLGPKAQKAMTVSLTLGPINNDLSSMEATT
jgi:galactose mutarotase-like enzyme